MEIFEDESDIDRKYQLFKSESSDMKMEPPDTKDVFKRETNATVNDERIDFKTENGQKSENFEYELFIKKENPCDIRPKYDIDTGTSSSQTESAESYLTSKTSKNSNMFSIHPQDFNKSKTQDYTFIDYIEPYKFGLKSFSENGDSRNQYNIEGEEIKQKNENWSNKIPNEGNSTIQREHLNNKIKYLCEYCRRGYSQKGYLKTHINTHIHGNKRYTCCLCSHKFSQKTSLKIHINSVHNKIKDYKCILCSYECSLRDQLKRHIDSVHNKIKEHNCNLCSYKCSTNTILKKHIKRMHEQLKEKRNNIKGHKCNICYYEFSSKSCLKTHVDSVHNKIKHKCNIC